MTGVSRRRTRRRFARWRIAVVLAATVVSIAPPGWPATNAAGHEDLPRVIVHDNMVRTYELHVPPQASPGATLPLVIMLHGGYGDSNTARGLAGFDELADEEGFLVAYPNGVDRHWNDGRERPLDPPSKPDDVGFITALADELVETHGADPDRTFVTGMSNGALMAGRLACERADRFLAIAPVAGAMSVGVAESCTPSRAVSVMYFMGTEDLQYEGNKDGDDRGGPVRSVLSGGRTIGVMETMALWADNAACTSVSETLLPDVDPDDGTRVRQHDYEGCTSGNRVVLYEIEGGDHSWPGSDRTVSTGTTSQDIDATETMWKFFASLCPTPARRPPSSAPPGEPPADAPPCRDRPQGQHGHETGPNGERVR